MKTHVGLFEGIGGFSLAAKWAGYETIAWCEINSWCQKLLRYRFPNAYGHSNIKTTNFKEYAGKIDVLTGGDPCQPSSTAGKGLGVEDDRFLWPEMYRAITEARPRWVINENVSGTISNRILDQKISDLECADYTCWPAMLIPAGAFGALHRRDRVWLVAYSNAIGSQTFPKQLANCICEEDFKSESPGTVNPLSRTFITSGSREELFTDELPLARGTDGIPKELDAIAGLGNAIVPQVAFEFFKAINKTLGV